MVFSRTIGIKRRALIKNKREKEKGINNIIIKSPSIIIV